MTDLRKPNVVIHIDPARRAANRPIPAGKYDPYETERCKFRVVATYRHACGERRTYTYCFDDADVRRAKRAATSDRGRSPVSVVVENLTGRPPSTGPYWTPDEDGE